MSKEPYGPHGPKTQPYDVLPGPTIPTGPPPQIGSDDTWEAPVQSSGGGGGLGGVLAQIILSVLMVAILWIPTVCLYPLTALIGIGAGFLTVPIFARLLPPDGGDVASVLGVAVGVVLIGTMIRVEYRLANNSLYRIGRHVIRLVLLSLVAIPVIQLTLGAQAETTTTRYIFSVLNDPRQIARFLSSSQNIAILIGVAVALHFILWNERLRKFWHGRLKWVGLK
jgi:ACR3 family arsenite efflux pump ArsB